LILKDWPFIANLLLWGGAMLALAFG